MSSCNIVHPKPSKLHSSGRWIIIIVFGKTRQGNQLLSVTYNICDADKVAILLNALPVYGWFDVQIL